MANSRLLQAYERNRLVSSNHMPGAVDQGARMLPMELLPQQTKHMCRGIKMAVGRTQANMYGNPQCLIILVSLFFC